MSFDLAIWVGEQPSDDNEALATFRRLMAQAERDFDAGVTRATDPTLRKCVREITGRYSDGILGRLPGSIWTSPPITPQGSIVYMNLRWGLSPAVIEFIARTAAKHELVCFDPQASRVVDAAELASLRESHAASESAFARVVRFLKGE